MKKFKMQSSIAIISIEAIELNINPRDYGILDSEDTILHLIEGEFMYCDVAVDGKLLVTENQLDQILTIENISIHKIFNSILYINSLSPAGRNKFNQSKKQVEYVSTENFEDDLQDDGLIFGLIS
jgi:hypothetical protein